MGIGIRFYFSSCSLIRLQLNRHSRSVKLSKKASLSLLLGRMCSTSSAPCFDFKTCTVQTDAEIPYPGNQLSCMLHELVFLGCHLQLTSYPYTFASYSYSCKILQPYVAATVRMHSDAVGIVLHWCSSNENSHKK